MTGTPLTPPPDLGASRDEGWHLDLEERPLGAGLVLEYLSYHREPLNPPALDLLLRVHLSDLGRALALRSASVDTSVLLRVEQVDHLDFAVETTAEGRRCFFGGRLRVDFDAQGDLTFTAEELLSPGPCPVETPLPGLGPVMWWVSLLPAPLVERAGLLCWRVPTERLLPAILEVGGVHLPELPEGMTAELALYRNQLSLRLASLEGEPGVAPQGGGEGEPTPPPPDELGEIDRRLLAGEAAPVCAQLYERQVRERSPSPAALWRWMLALEEPGRTHTSLPALRRYAGDALLGPTATCIFVRHHLAQGEVLRAALLLRQSFSQLSARAAGSLRQWIVGQALLPLLRAAGSAELAPTRAVVDQLSAMLAEEALGRGPGLTEEEVRPTSHLPGFDDVLAALTQAPHPRAELALVPSVLIPPAGDGPRSPEGLKALMQALSQPAPRAQGEDLATHLRLRRERAAAQGAWREHLEEVEAQLVDASPEDDRLLRWELTHSYRQMGVPTRAVPSLRALLTTDPDDHEAEALLRATYEGAGQIGARIKLDAWLARVRLPPAQAHGRLLQLAREAASHGLVESEMSCLREACGVDVLPLTPFLRLDTLLKSRGALDEVAQLWRLREELPAPAGVEASLRAAEALMEAGELPLARGRLERLLERDPNHPGAVRLLLGVLHRQGDERASRALLERRGALSPMETTLLSAEEALARGDLDQAEREFSQVRESPEGQVRAVQGLCRVYLARGQARQAAALLEEVIRLSPSPALRARWQRELGDLHLVHLGDAQQARSLYSQAGIEVNV